MMDTPVICVGYILPLSSSASLTGNSPSLMRGAGWDVGGGPRLLDLEEG